MTDASSGPATSRRRAAWRWREIRVVTVDGSDVIQALKPTGDALWKQDGFVRRGLTAPVMLDGRVLFGDRFGNFSVLSLTDGSPLARLDLERQRAGVGSGAGRRRVVCPDPARHRCRPAGPVRKVGKPIATRNPDVRYPR